MYKNRSAEALAKPLTGMLEDFDAFFEKLEKRKEELDEVRDELLIYSDPELLESVKRADADAAAGRLKHCRNASEIKRLFESL
jgi:flagellar motility protein MotE (MotC chaperone)